MIKNITDRMKGLFGYDAAESSTRRQNVGTVLKSTDQLLPDRKRRKLVAGARDLTQNFSIAAWAVRRHLDYCTSFSFQADTGSTELNQRIEELMGWYSRAHNCDVAHRHPLARLIRIAECRRTLDGDVFLAKLNNGTLQGIEGDRVRDPDRLSLSKEDEIWQHGIRTSPASRLLEIAVHSRTDGGGFDFERRLPARNIWQLGYFDRYDQVRGVSPLASAINSFRDTYEMFGYALAKAKVSQLFALAIYSDIGAEGDAFGDSTSDDTDSPGYDVDFGQGPIKLHLDPGDKADFLESKTPSTELQQFCQLVIGSSLKALDIPFSFYDESFTNFFGSRAAWQHYEVSCRSKRADVRELLDKITFWRLQMFVRDGYLELPAGVDIQDLRWDWIHAGTPWWDPAKEIRADVMAIEAGLTTRTKVIRERHGLEFRDVADKLAEEQEYLQSKGVITSALPSALDTEEESTDENSN